MFSRLLAVLIFIAFVCFGAFFLYFNKSYELSFKAKFYYSISNYQKAYELAKQAYELDWKNKMADGVLKQSILALEYESYLGLALDYKNRIKAMSEAGISKADKARIELMCDVMINSFLNLKTSATLPSELSKRAAKARDDFLKLKNELF